MSAVPTGSPTREWVMAVPPGTLFSRRDVPGPASAVDPALSRLASDSGPIERLRRGLYRRRPEMTRFGVPSADPLEVALAVAGPGAGPAGASAVNATGLSTQVPRRPIVAVIGRPPAGVKGVRLTSRANPLRVLLDPHGIAVLESIRAFDELAEIGWPEALNRLGNFREVAGVPTSTLATVAQGERGELLRRRVAELTSE